MGSTTDERYVDVVTYIRAELGRFRGRRLDNPSDSPSYDANRAYLGKVRPNKAAIENLNNLPRPKKPPGRK